MKRARSRGTFFVLTTWAGASTSVKVGEERVQLVRAEEGISAELPLQRGCYSTHRDKKYTVQNMQGRVLQLCLHRLSLHIQCNPVSSAILMPTYTIKVQQRPDHAADQVIPEHPEQPESFRSMASLTDQVKIKGFETYCKAGSRDTKENTQSSIYMVIYICITLCWISLV